MPLRMGLIIACVAWLTAVPCLMAQPSAAQEDADTPEAASEDERLDVQNDRDTERPALRRYLRHFLMPDQRPTNETPLWLITPDDGVPYQVQAEVQAIREVEAAIARVSTIQNEDVQIRVTIPRPSWRITIPIR